MAIDPVSACLLCTCLACWPCCLPLILPIPYPLYIITLNPKNKEDQETWSKYNAKNAFAVKYLYYKMHKIYSDAKAPMIEAVHSAPDSRKFSDSCFGTNEFSMGDFKKNSVSSCQSRRKLVSIGYIEGCTSDYKTISGINYDTEVSVVESKGSTNLLAECRKNKKLSEMKSFGDFECDSCFRRNSNMNLKQESWNQTNRNTGKKAKKETVRLNYNIREENYKWQTKKAREEIDKKLRRKSVISLHEDDFSTDDSLEKKTGNAPLMKKHSTSTETLVNTSELLNDGTYNLTINRKGGGLYYLTYTREGFVLKKCNRQYR